MRLLPFAVAAALAVAAPAHADLFDKPIATLRVKTKLPHPDPGQKHVLTCFYYRGIRVKQLDLGEVGASLLALLPLKPDATRVPCKEPAEPGELIIPGNVWSGYFDGARGDYAFFNVEDGTNGGLGFAVFDGRTGRKLFEDLAVGKIRAIEPTATGLRLQYRRAVSGKCSIKSAGDTCWSQTLALLPGVAATPIPDCTIGYQKAKAAMANGRCEAQNSKTPACLAKEMHILDEQHWDDAPSVIGYDVTADVGPSAAAVKPTAGALSCWPSD